MKLSTRHTRLLAVLSVASIAAGCGVGNDQDAGSLTNFNVVPTEITLTGPDANTCGTGYAGRVYVFGGDGPYVVKNSGGAPSGGGTGYVQVSRTSLSRSGDFFEVTLLGCMENIAVAVVDQKGRQAIVSLSSTVGE